MSDKFNEAAERQGHVLRRDEDGEIDSFALDVGFHNGPGCINCGDTWCEHCVRPENIMPCIGKEAADARDKAAHHMGRTRYTCGYKPARSRYMPHQGDREIARRQRQAARGVK